MSNLKHLILYEDHKIDDLLKDLMDLGIGPDRVVIYMHKAVKGKMTTFLAISFPNLNKREDVHLSDIAYDVLYQKYNIVLSHPVTGEKETIIKGVNQKIAGACNLHLHKQGALWKDNIEAWLDSLADSFRSKVILTLVIDGKEIYVSDNDKPLYLYEDHNIDSLLKDLHGIGLTDGRVILRNEIPSNLKGIGTFDIILNPDDITEEEIFNDLEEEHFEISLKEHLEFSSRAQTWKNIVKNRIRSRIAAGRVENVRDVLIDWIHDSSYNERTASLIIDGKLIIKYSKDSLTDAEKDRWAALQQHNSI